MVDNIRYVEKTIAQNYGDSIKDLEDMNYWELLKILGAKKQGSPQKQSNNESRNAYEFLKHHMV